MGAYCGCEITIVGHEEQGLVERRGQMVLKPYYSGEIQEVGGFVKQEDVGTLGESGGEISSRAPASGEGEEWRVDDCDCETETKEYCASFRFGG